MQRIQTDLLLLYPLIPVKICLIRDVFGSGELLPKKRSCSVQSRPMNYPSGAESSPIAFS